MAKYENEKYVKKQKNIAYKVLQYPFLFVLSSSYANIG